VLVLQVVLVAPVQCLSVPKTSCGVKSQKVTKSHPSRTQPKGKMVVEPLGAEGWGFIEH
jgi:hypothetical protein